MELELPVVWYNEDQQKLVDAGMEDDIDIKKCGTKEHTFYRIDVISSHDNNHTTIFSGSQSFVVRKKYRDLKKLIKNQTVFNFN